MSNVPARIEPVLEGELILPGDPGGYGTIRTFDELLEQMRRNLEVQADYIVSRLASAAVRR